MVIIISEGLVEDCSISSALATEMPVSCGKPSTQSKKYEIFHKKFYIYFCQLNLIIHAI